MMRIFTLIGLSAATMLTPVAASAAQMTPQAERVSVMQAPTAAAADDRGRGDRRQAQRGGNRAGPQANRNQGNRNQPARAYREGRRDGAQQARQNYQRVERRDERNDNRRENRAYRDGRQDQRHVYRDRHDDNRFEYQGRRHDRWNNNWRNDRRYNYSSYRASNRDRYRGNRYYAPSRGHNYRRFNIGFSIGAPYYASNYWLNDPGYYRLPPAYGPYRWVRYYDDVMLIDVRNGYVVDVIHSFFW